MPAGVGAAEAGSSATFDARGQATSMSLGGTGGAATLGYEYTPAGEVAQTTSAGLPGPASQALTYDDAGRLTSAGGLTFDYDAAENLVKLGATDPLTYDAAGQLGSSTTGGVQTSYGYDAAGARTSQTPAGGNATTFGYDAAGRLASVDKAGVPSVTYGYDGDNLRVRRTVGGAAADTYVWDKTSQVPLLLEENATSYVYGPDGLPFAGIGEDDTVRYYHQDRLGSTRRVTDETGAVVAERTYDAYGNTTHSTGTARVPFGFAGEYADEPSGLIYLRARFYDPATGQFLSRDPLEAQTWQPYVYAGGDPINAIDPLGLSVGDFITGAKNKVVSVLDSVSPVVNKAAGAVATIGSAVSVACVAGMSPTVVGVGLCAPAVGVTAGAGAVALGTDAYLTARGKQSPAGLIWDLIGMTPGRAVKLLRISDDELLAYAKTYAAIFGFTGYGASWAEDLLGLYDNC